MNKSKLNAIYNIVGDPTSGVLNPVDLNSAIAYVERFNNPQTFQRQVIVVEGTGKDRKVLLQTNPDGSPKLETVPEVSPKQGNGYDSYVNHFGWARTDQPYDLPPVSLTKVVLVAIDALHRYAVSENAETANAAKAALSAIRDYDKVAARKTAERARQEAYEKALAIVVENGGSKDAFDAAWNATNTVPAAPIENADELSEEAEAQTV